MSKRIRGNKIQYTIKNKKFLKKPIYLTFDIDQEDEGDDYYSRLKKLVAVGIVPEEYSSSDQPEIISEIFISYKKYENIKPEDVALLNTCDKQFGQLQSKLIDYNWVETWVHELKVVRKLAPGTIRKYVGALARCFDWAYKKSYVVANPFRMLKKGYSTYTSYEKKLTGGGKEDESRERRLESGEEEKVRTILSGEKVEGRQRPIVAKHQAAVEFLFVLALESAMRLREMFTLYDGQFDLKSKTVFLEKTKNGSKRQVPLTSVAIQAYKNYKKSVKKQTGGMEGYNIDKILFPFWNGVLTKKELDKTSNKLSKKYTSIFEAADMGDFNFHDLRHEATSRLFEKTTLSEFKIAKITGHSNMKTLARYANLRGSNLADELW